MTPSVRGWRKARVASLLALAAGAAGALAGFAAGVAWALAGLPRLPAAAAAGLVALTAAADSLYWWNGAPRPLSVRRQVPVLWTRVFSPETVALLFGARLGVGPLTILPTWAWWTALVLGASTGPIRSLFILGFFGVARVVLIVVVGEWVRGDMVPRMGRLARREGAVSVLVGGMYVATLPLLAVLT